MAFDENIKKRNLLILFKFNGELNVLVPAIEIRKELNSGVLLNKVKVSSTYLNQMVGRAPLFITHFSSKSHIKILAKTVPKGDPMATPSIWS